MPVLKLPADTPNQWPGLVYDVMQTPVGAETGALFDAMEADASQL